MKTWQWVAIGTGSMVMLTLLNRHRVMSNLKNIQLAPNFNLSEFVKTSTGLENIPGEREIENLRSLVTNVLQPLRNGFSKKYSGSRVYVISTSGYRSPLVNKTIGGADTSQHLYGQATDFHVLVDGRKLSNQEVINMIHDLDLPYDQLIDEDVRSSQWVHVSYIPNGRLELLTARDGASGKTVYTRIT